MAPRLRDARWDGSAGSRRSSRGSALEFVRSTMKPLTCVLATTLLALQAGCAQNPPYRSHHGQPSIEQMGGASRADLRQRARAAPAAPRVQRAIERMLTWREERRSADNGCGSNTVACFLRLTHALPCEAFLLACRLRGRPPSWRRRLPLRLVFPACEPSSGACRISPR